MRRAVVLGGGIAGLLAARVLSEHAEDVAVVEPDDIDAVGGGRPGAPQSNQLHALLDMGRVQMERWWPGLSGELAADGAVLGKGAAIRMYVNGVRKVTVPGNEMIGVTRPLLERHLRRRTLARENVRLLGGRATGLVFRGGRVRGARYSPDGAPGSEVEAPADLVVDATGRATRLDHWLRAGGWPSPPLERMRIDLGYATALLRRGGELPGLVVAQSLVSPARPGMPHHPSAAMAAVEGDRWMVVVADYGRRQPHPDREDFLRLCRNAPAAPFREVADNCVFDSDVVAYRMADSRRRQFTRLGCFPAGLVALGDAVASFNPVYGQGMTCAALHASCLASHLRSGTPPEEPAWGYFCRIRTVVDAAWQLSTLNDLAQPHVTGPYPRGYRMARWLGDRITQASVTDPEVGRIYLDVLNMRTHPKALRSPATLLKVARALRDQWAGGQERCP